MELKKSYWKTDGDNINLSVPFVKVDKERRMVSGFATLDNVDKQGDVVDTQASLDAFKRFRGNIREMHQPIAVGKVVSFKQHDFYDAKTKKNYSGVFVDVYVSKGAQDTWEKVLDGTLSGFSIGGNINKSDTAMDHEDYSGPVRLIKEYDLVELSLVDNPANQLANVFSIQKSDIGFTVTGIATEVKASNVFYCPSDEVAVTSDSESNKCSVCDSTMENIGWVEQGSDTKFEDVEEVVDRYLGKVNKSNELENITGKGGNKVDELNNEVVEEVAEAPAEEVVEVESAEAPAEVAEEIQKSDEVSDEEPAVEEVVAEEPVAEVAEEAAADEDFEKMLEGIKSYIEDTIAKSQDTPGVEQIIAEMEGRIGKMMDEKHGEMSKAVEGMKGELESIKSRMDSYEASTAVKKSNDSAFESVETVRKSESIWKGHFLGVQDL
jgi:hypothetical protein